MDYDEGEEEQSAPAPHRGKASPAAQSGPHAAGSTGSQSGVSRLSSSSHVGPEETSADLTGLSVEELQTRLRAAKSTADLMVDKRRLDEEAQAAAARAREEQKETRRWHEEQDAMRRRQQQQAEAVAAEEAEKAAAAAAAEETKRATAAAAAEKPPPTLLASKKKANSKLG